MVVVNNGFVLESEILLSLIAHDGFIKPERTWRIEANLILKVTPLRILPCLI